MKNKFLIYYIFIEELNEIIIKNILILKNEKYRLSIITSDKNIYKVSRFARIYRIPFYVIDNAKAAIKNYASGVFLSSKNKNLSNNIKKQYFSIARKCSIYKGYRQITVLF